MNNGYLYLWQNLVRLLLPCAAEPSYVEQAPSILTLSHWPAKLATLPRIIYSHPILFRGAIANRGFRKSDGFSEMKYTYT